MTAPRLFLDMDGVLADFDTGYEARFGMRPDKAKDDVDWKKVEAAQDFYATLPPMADLPILWDYARRFEPTVLTGIPRIPGVYEQKRVWVQQYLGADVEVIGCRSADKADHCAPGDVLVDDWEKYRHKWVAAGGVWITHVSAVDTIKRLGMMGW
jgi:hypothetical protein